MTCDAIIAGRDTFVLDMMGSFYVRGYGDGSPESGSRAPDIVMAGGNAAGRAAASGAMHATAIQDSAGLFKRKVGRVSNKIVADYGEQQITLAKWLPWKRAEMLHAEIVNALERLGGDESVTSSG